MRIPTAPAASILACLLIATTAHALITSYGPRQMEEAGVGCVGGLVSDHGDTAYFCGDTARLNERLAMLATSTIS